MDSLENTVPDKEIEPSDEQERRITWTDRLCNNYCEFMCTLLRRYWKHIIEMEPPHQTAGDIVIDTVDSLQSFDL